MTSDEQPKMWLLAEPLDDADDADGGSDEPRMVAVAVNGTVNLPLSPRAGDSSFIFTLVAGAYTGETSPSLPVASASTALHGPSSLAVVFGPQLGPGGRISLREDRPGGTLRPASGADPLRELRVLAGQIVEEAKAVTLYARHEVAHPAIVGELLGGDLDSREVSSPVLGDGFSSVARRTNMSLTFGRGYPSTVRAIASMLRPSSC